MTREEAIAFFKDMNECTYGNLEAVEMAIEALQAQAEPQVKCDACIHHHGELLECDMYGCRFEPKQADKKFKMRDCTPEEQEATYKYIHSISKPTGVNVFDFYEDEEQEELDFVQPKKSIPCTIKVQADRDLISRQAVLDIAKSSKSNWIDNSVSFKRVNELSPVKPQEAYDFAKWVASEIFDDMWEYNKDSFAEIACRKLAMLGIVRAKGDEWELVEQEPKTDNDIDMKLKLMEANINGYTQGLKDVSNTEQEPKWIPVSERLPEKSDRYLAYIVNRHDDKLQYIMTCDYSVDGYWNWFPDAESASDNVIAWMPLPTPYKPQESEE